MPGLRSAAMIVPGERSDPLSARDLLINHRIYQAAIRRLNALVNHGGAERVGPFAGHDHGRGPQPWHGFLRPVDARHSTRGREGADRGAV
jgi:hypothetical protein